MGERSDDEVFLAWVSKRREAVQANERSFRRHNRRRGRVEHEAVGADEAVPFVCECGDRACREAMELTICEFEDAHSGPDRFTVRPGHVLPEFEEVVARYDRYWVARKFSDAEALQRAVLPASDGGETGEA